MAPAEADVDPVADLVLQLTMSGRASDAWRARWMEGDDIGPALSATTDVPSLRVLASALQRVNGGVSGAVAASMGGYATRLERHRAADEVVFALGEVRLRQVERAFALEKVDPLAPVVAALENGHPPSSAWERLWGEYGDALEEAWRCARDAEAMRRILAWAGEPRDEAEDAETLRRRVPKPPRLELVIAGAARNPRRLAPLEPHPRTFETFGPSRRSTSTLVDVAHILPAGAVPWLAELTPWARTVGDLRSRSTQAVLQARAETERVDAIYAALKLPPLWRPEPVRLREGCVYVRATPAAVRDALRRVFAEAGLAPKRNAKVARSTGEELGPDVVLVWEEPSEGGWTAVASARDELTDPRGHPLARRLARALDRPVLALRCVDEEGVNDIVAVGADGGVVFDAARDSSNLAQVFGLSPDTLPDDVRAADLFDCAGFASFADTVRDTFEDDPEGRRDAVLAFGRARTRTPSPKA